MSVGLKKGQKILLSENYSQPEELIVAIGWESAAKAVGGIMGFRDPTPLDCKISALMLTDGILKENTDLIYFGNRTHSSGGIIYIGSDGSGEKVIEVYPGRIPEKYDRIIFAMTIYDAFNLGQNFSRVRDMYIRINDASDGREICRFHPKGDYMGMTAIIMGDLHRFNGGWRFGGMGQGTRDGKITELAQRYA